MPYPLNLSRQIEDCKAIENELKSCMSPDDIRMLRDTLLPFDRQRWYNWLETNAGVVVDFLAEPPAVRRAQHRWSAYPARLWIVLAALQRVRRARTLLLHVDRHCLMPWAGGSSRDFAVRAAQAQDDIDQYGDVHGYEWWPFEGDNPFEPS